MARKVKTDLFAGIMKDPVKEDEKSVIENGGDVKAEAGGNNTGDQKPVTGKQGEIKEKPKTQRDKNDDEPDDAVAPETESAGNSIDEFLKKEAKPKAASHTFYLKDSTFKKLEATAKKKKTSTSKLLEAMIEMTLK